MPRHFVHMWRVDTRNDHPTRSRIRDRRMHGGTDWIQLADRALTEPLIEPREESEHPIARVPFGVWRLVQAQVTRPLDVRKSSEPLMGRLYGRMIERKPGWNIQNQAFAISQRQTVSGTRQVTGSKCNIDSNPPLEAAGSLADCKNLESSSAQFLNIPELLDRQPLPFSHRACRI